MATPDTVKHFRFLFGNDDSFIVRVNVDDSDDLEMVTTLSGALAAKHGACQVQVWDHKHEWQEWDAISAVAIERWLRCSLSPHSMPLKPEPYL